MSKSVAWLTVLVCFMMPQAWALARVCGDDLIEIKSALGEMTEIVVENAVADLVRSGDPATLKVEHTAGHLFVTPLSLNAAELSIIDTRGHSYRVRHVLGERVDAKIVIADCTETRNGFANDGSSMQFLRDLVRERIPKEATVKDVDRVIFLDQTWQVRISKMIEMPPLVGYVASVKNLGSLPAIIPVSRLKLKGLRAVTVGQDMLEPGAQTSMYLMVRP